MRVVITGASSGLGSALAACLPQVRCECVGLDVTDAAALRRVCSDFIQRHGVPDVVVANAGISAGTATGMAGDRPVFQRILEVNLLAMVDTFEPFVVPMQRAGTGILVGISSVAGIRGLPGAEAYSASKAAASAYLESLRVGLRGDGIAVVTLAPGYVRTEMTAGNDYPMPFLMSADAFARRAVDAILRRQSYRTIPWQMAWVAAVLRLMPNWLYDRLFARAPRKARNPSLGRSDD